MPKDIKITDSGAATYMDAGAKAKATPTLVRDFVSAISLTSGGSGYTVAPAVTITGKGGSGAAATATIAGGVVTGITLTSEGTGYKDVQVSIEGDATATATLDKGKITSIAVDEGGAQFSSAPAVTINDATGSGAAATAVLAGDSVASITVTNEGTNYSNPTIVLGEPDDTPIYSMPTEAGVNNNIMVVTSSGTEFSNTLPYVPAVSSDWVNTSQTYVASAIDEIVSRLKVIETALTAANSDIVGATEVEALQANVATITATLAGVTSGSGGGSGATATASITDDAVSSVSVTNAGSGYTSAPNVSFSGGAGSGAQATATVSSGEVTGITVTNGGSGYTSAPTVSIG